jgi:hypothetical protein
LGKINLLSCSRTDISSLALPDAVARTWTAAEFGRRKVVYRRRRLSNLSIICTERAMSSGLIRNADVVVEKFASIEKRRLIMKL